MCYDRLNECHCVLFYIHISIFVSGAPGAPFAELVIQDEASVATTMCPPGRPVGRTSS